MHNILYPLSLLVVVQYVTVMHINYQRSKFGDRSKTALNAKTEQFITAKVSSNALKHGVEHTQYHVSAVHNCKNIRLCECLLK